MYKIGIVGEKDTIAGFRVLGLEAFPVKTPQETRELLESLSKQDYAVIYITEQAAQPVMDYIRELKTRTLPAIVLIPGNKGSMGIAVDEIKNAVEKAVGINILGN